MKMQNIYHNYADEAQENLIKNYWNEQSGIFYDKFPRKTADILNYWWMAHAIDALADAFIRTGDAKFKDYADKTLDAVIARNNGSIVNDYYDDMQWMALALLRLYDRTFEGKYLAHVRELWADITGGWNGHCGGGIAWRKPQLNYKNTPANAPAAILAARLYNTLGSPEYLDWSVKLFAFVDARLTDAQTGQIWDGMNREGDGRIDKQWCFTYCHGVYIGAAVELYKITHEQDYLGKAMRTAKFALERFTRGGIFVTEQGEGDGGMFKGILLRYLAELYKIVPDCAQIRDVILANAAALRESGTAADGRYGKSWLKAPEPHEGFDLTVQLSGVMLYEMASVIN